MFAKIHLLILWFAIITALSSPAPAKQTSDDARHAFKEGVLVTVNTNFDPPFIIANQRSKVKVNLELADPSMRFLNDTLILEQQKQRPNGQTVFVPIAELRDGGKHDNDCQSGDHGNRNAHCQENQHDKSNNEYGRDGIYTGTVIFNEDVSGTINLRVRGLEKYLHQILVSPPLSLPVQFACGPTGNILPINIFNGNGDNHQSQVVEFDVAEGGKAILRIVNGARIGAPVGERVANAKVSINGRQVEVIRKGSNVIELPVRLVGGTNELEINKAIAKSGQRLSARIDTCADTLELKPVSDTQQVGGILVTEATLTGLGAPIPNAPVSFNLSNLGNFPKQTTTTTETGVARTTLPPFTTAGAGNLKASTVTTKPLLKDMVTIKVVSTPSIGVRRAVSDISIKAGEAKDVSFFADLFKADNLAYSASFEQIVEPNDGGITLTPTGVQTINFEATPVGQEITQRIKEIPVSFKGVKAGSYTITSRVTLKGSGETTSTSLDVEVLPAQETLVLSTPTIQPGSILKNQSSTEVKYTPVVFKAKASGVTTLPDELKVEQCIPAPGSCDEEPGASGWITLGNLLDDGLDTDIFKGDGIYSGELPVTGNEDQEGQLLYRVTGRNGLVPSLSNVNFLQVSRFPNGPDSAPSETIEDQTNSIQLVAEQVLVSFVPATTPDRIVAIVNQVAFALTGEIGAVIGQIPEIGLFQVKLSVDPGLTDAVRVGLVNAAITQFESYDEVRYAEPNTVVSPASIPDDGGTKQWGLPRIRADKVWDTVTTPGAKVVVAVVDSGVYAEHSEFGGYSCNTTSSAQLTCQSDRGGDTEPAALNPNGHGTGVAAVIAAKHGNGGISGIAYGAKIYSYNTNGFTLVNRIAGVTSAVNVGADIINLSWEQETLPYDGLFCALKYAASTPTDIGGIVVEGIYTKCSTMLDKACEKTMGTKTYCNSKDNTGHGKLVVVAAGNGDENHIGINIPTTKPLYPCSWESLVLCVGNTDQNDYVYQSSNNGPDVKIYAPGTSIYTADKSGNWFYGTGTTYSAPHVSAAAAILLAEHPGWSSETIKTRLKTFAKKITDSKASGNGRLDILAAVGNIISGNAWLTTIDPTGDWKGLGYDDRNWKTATDNAIQGNNNTPDKVCKVINEKCEGKDSDGFCKVIQSINRCKNHSPKFMWHPDNPGEAYFRLKFWINCTTTTGITLDANIIADDYFEFWVNGKNMGNRLLDAYKTDQPSNPGIPRPFNDIALQCGENVLAIHANDGGCNGLCPDSYGSNNTYFGNPYSRDYRAVFFDGKID